jgi:hypothetical protein
MGESIGLLARKIASEYLVAWHKGTLYLRHSISNPAILSVRTFVFSVHSQLCEGELDYKLWEKEIYGLQNVVLFVTNENLYAELLEDII